MLPPTLLPPTPLPLPTTPELALLGAPTPDPNGEGKSNELPLLTLLLGLPPADAALAGAEDGLTYAAVSLGFLGIKLGFGGEVIAEGDLPVLPPNFSPA